MTCKRKFGVCTYKDSDAQFGHGSERYQAIGIRAYLNYDIRARLYRQMKPFMESISLFLILRDLVLKKCAL